MLDDNVVARQTFHMLNATKIPARLSHLPRDPRGYVIPGVRVDKAGRAHFTINDEDRRVRALTLSLCPICGTSLHRARRFLGGRQRSIARRVH